MTSTARHREPSPLLPAAAAALADLVLARTCGGCGAEGTRWCGPCGRRLVDEPLLRRLDDGLLVWSAAAYEDSVRTAIVAWKDRGRADLTTALAVGLRRAVSAAIDERTADDHAGTSAGPLSSTALVPVPSSARSRRSRGHEPVLDLARAVARSLRRRGEDVRVLPVLRPLRRVDDQAALDAGQRSRNLQGALTVPAGWATRLAGRDLVLVDDVVTTGATLVEAARALSGAGARVVAAATVASTPLRGAGPER